MKRNVIVLGAALVILLVAGAIFTSADDPPPRVILGPQPVRIVAGVVYVVQLPPSETGIVANLVLANADKWNAPVIVAGHQVSVPPTLNLLFRFEGVEGAESEIEVTRGSYPWSGGKEGFAWGSVGYSQTKTTTQYNARAQPITRRILPR